MSTRDSVIPDYTGLIVEKQKKRDKKKKKGEKETEAHASTRTIFSAPSKNGKSTLLFEDIRRTNKEDPIDVLILCVKEPDEPTTKELQRIFKKRCIVVESVFDVPPINSFKKELHNVIVFDDICNESEKAEKRMSEYFTRGRKRGISIKLLTQSSFGIPRRYKTNATKQWLRPTNDEDENKQVARKYNMPASLLLYLFSTLKKFQFLGLSEDDGISINFQPIDIDEVKNSEAYETFLRKYKEERKKLK